MTDTYIYRYIHTDTDTYRYRYIHTDTDTYRYRYIQTQIYTDTDIYRHRCLEYLQRVNCTKVLQFKKMSLHCFQLCIVVESYGI